MHALEYNFSIWEKKIEGPKLYKITGKICKLNSSKQNIFFIWVIRLDIFRLFVFGISTFIGQLNAEVSLFLSDYMVSSKYYK